MEEDQDVGDDPEEWTEIESDSTMSLNPEKSTKGRYEENDEGLVFGVVLDGKGGVRQVGWRDLDQPLAEGEILWLHLDYEHERVVRWIEESSGLDEFSKMALMASEPRPRSLVKDETLLATLRGVNLNPGADPDDMVSLRVCVEPRRIITLRHQRVIAVRALRDEILAGKGPKDGNEFFCQLIERLLDLMEEVVENLEFEVDRLEEDIIDGHMETIRQEINSLRRMAIGLRRYIVPQRQAMSRLVSEDVKWFTERTRGHLREFTDRLTRFVEDLDAARERAAVVQEELAGRVSERMNETMYMISVFTVIFLPLGLLTGLLGINVGGMPGVENSHAFWIVCGLLVVLTVISILLLRKKHWL